MDVIIEALQDVSAGLVITWIIAITGIVIGLVKLGCVVYDKLSSYFEMKQKNKEKREQVFDSLLKLSEKIDNIEKKVNNLDNKYGELEVQYNEQNKKYTEDIIARYRASIWRQHRELMSQGYVTESDLHTFTECVNRYEERGGNDVVHNKLAPEVYALPVKY